MSNYQKALLYYRMGFWTKQMLHMLVDKEYITKTEYKTITGEDY
jgi:hypothetical protein